MTGIAAPNLYELTVSRSIAAPPARVWQVMTERLPDWWCPKPWTTEIVALDWRAGGRAAMVMRGPDGEQSPIEGIVLEFTPGRRFVFTDAISFDWTPKGPFMIGLFEIEREGDGTRYTARARHWTVEAMRQHREMGFEQGWNKVAEQLAQIAEHP